jgi:hypothetical protein
MKTLLSLVLGSALLVLPSLAQTDKDISLSEFRQSMYDVAALVDARQGTTLTAQFQNISDETLAKWYKAVPDGRRFQHAASVLKSRAQSGGLPARTRPYASQLMAANPRRASALTESQMPMASPAAGITLVAPPDLTLATPVYADDGGPGSAPQWEGLVNTLQVIGALPSGSAYSLRAQRCDHDTKVLYSVLASTFAGIKDAADSACEIIPDVLIVILGEGTEIPFKEICFGICLALNVLNSAVAGLNGDCEENDGLIQGAEIEAAYKNTLALYNVKVRLKIEKNLGDTTAPMGLFELPSGLGGYLETARSIVADTLAKMTAAGVNANATAANTALLQGDTYYNLKSYKLAYKQYQTAYGYAVK